MILPTRLHKGAWVVDAQVWWLSGRVSSLLCYQRLTCANSLPFVRKCLFCIIASEHVEVGLARSFRGITQAEMTCQCSADSHEPARDP